MLNPLTICGFALGAAAGVVAYMGHRPETYGIVCILGVLGGGVGLLTGWKVGAK